MIDKNTAMCWQCSFNMFHEHITVSWVQKLYSSMSRWILQEYAVSVFRILEERRHTVLPNFWHPSATSWTTVNLIFTTVRTLCLIHKTFISMCRTTYHHNHEKSLNFLSIRGAHSFPKWSLMCGHHFKVFGTPKTYSWSYQAMKNVHIWNMLNCECCMESTFCLTILTTVWSLWDWYLKYCSQSLVPSNKVYVHGLPVNYPEK